MNFIDSHCHIDGEAFDADRDEIIKRANDAGVKIMLTVGTGNPHDGEIKRAVEVAEQYENVFASVGVHPHDAKTFNAESERRLIDLVKSSKKIIAWGEIGLDFYYDHSPREIQREVFIKQIRTAQKLDLPIIIHSRDADDETVEILTQECGSEDFRGGIMHCFGGTAEMAERLMNMGFLISFAGNVTFKKADNLRDAARIVPLDKLLIETDAPYLAPIPFRGKRNEPSFVVETAKFLADFYELEVEQLAKQTTQNFLDFFKLSLASDDTEKSGK
ncbi:MAG: TatD family hydrolase [Acidobacteriota bacterium]|nr:TatD family hydrolase [Acidobacteriota bacterium]